MRNITRQLNQGSKGDNKGSELKEHKAFKNEE